MRFLWGLAVGHVYANPTSSKSRSMIQDEQLHQDNQDSPMADMLRCVNDAKHAPKCLTFGGYVK
jgi:hypothetical protein